MDTNKINKQITIYKASDRGFANHGWLQAAHSFSFANYYDPNKVQFGALRVLNDDIIAPGMGFGTHPHDNMEIITIPLSGELKHRDSMQGNWQSVHVGDVQVMSAGTGVQHSEINGSKNKHLSLFQIWIMPHKQDVTPRYSQKTFDIEESKNKLQVLVSSVDDPVQESLTIHQDAQLSRIKLEADNHFEYVVKSEDHGVYMMNVYGEVAIGGQILSSRDAAGIKDLDSITLRAKEDSYLIFIEVPLL